MKVRIGQSAKRLGVSQETLRRWETAGKIEVERTPNGRRRYDLAKLHGLVSRPAAAGRPTLAYARESSDGQKEALERQVAMLETYCAANGWTYEVIQEMGSGLD
jgi:putative resolvase